MEKQVAAMKRLQYLPPQPLPLLQADMEVTPPAAKRKAALSLQETEDATAAEHAAAESMDLDKAATAQLLLEGGC